jgi:hypothetical protein
MGARAVVCGGSGRLFHVWREDGVDDDIEVSG